MNDHSKFFRPGPRELPTTQAAEGLPRLAWTLEDFERLIDTGILSEDDRIELIDGELVPKSPKCNRHENIKAVLIDWFYRRLPEGLMLTAELGWRPMGDRYIEPDIVIYKTGPQPSQVPPGDVLLAIEIAASSLAYDRGLKAQIYASLGVRDYWVIDAATLQTRVFREPGPTGYAAFSDIAADAALVPLLLPALALKLASLDVA